MSSSSSARVPPRMSLIDLTQPAPQSSSSSSTTTSSTTTTAAAAAASSTATTTNSLRRGLSRQSSSSGITNGITNGSSIKGARAMSSLSSSTTAQRKSVIALDDDADIANISDNSDDDDLLTTGFLPLSSTNSASVSQRSLSSNVPKVIDLTSPDRYVNGEDSGYPLSAPVKRVRLTLAPRPLSSVDVDALVASDEEFARRLQRDLEGNATPKALSRSNSSSSSAAAAPAARVVVDLESDAALAAALAAHEEHSHDEELARALQARENAWAAAEDPLAAQFRSALLSASGVALHHQPSIVRRDSSRGDNGYDLHNARRRDREWRNRHRRRREMDRMHPSLYGGGPSYGAALAAIAGGGRGLVGGVRLTGEALSLAQRELTDADYETLLALDDNVRPNKGASETMISRLPTRVLGASDAVDTCVICMEEMVGGSTVTTLPCTHKFHDDCIRSWLLVNKRCPIDKEAIE